MEKIAVFAHDIFNFANSGEAHKDSLFWWNCVEKTFSLLPSKDGIFLDNEDFRDFRKWHNFGGDFLVLSLPHQVEHFRGECYVYPL